MKRWLAMLILAVVTGSMLAITGGALHQSYGRWQQERKPTLRDATILKICHGSTIYRLRDGRIVAESGHRVENPETVCEAP